MGTTDPKDDLHRYLQISRDAVLWKLDGLSEYDARRPLVPTGNNLLGLVKHLAGVEFGYFGATFGRPSPDELEFDESEPNSDMYAFADEPRDFITGLYRKAWAHSDATIESLPLDAVGRVPWWPAERAEVTLHHVLVRVTDETARHAGQMDIMRELIDGAAGHSAGNSSLGPDDEASRRTHFDRVERAAREASGLSEQDPGGYRPDRLMQPDEAAAYHRPQIEAFAQAGADLATALTLTGIGEANG